MIAFALALFNALAAIPAILGYVEKFAAGVSLWYVQRQNEATLSAISDAAALASRASTDEERYKAAQAWQSALSRDRYSQ